MRGGPFARLGSGSFFRPQQDFHPADEFLRLEWLADQFVGLYGYGLVGDAFVYHA